MGTVHLPHACDAMVFHVRDPRGVVQYLPNTREYGVPRSSPFTVLAYCPFCGDRLPGSLRGELADRHPGGVADRRIGDGWWRGDPNLSLPVTPVEIEEEPRRARLVTDQEADLVSKLCEAIAPELGDRPESLLAAGTPVTAAPLGCDIALVGEQHLVAPGPTGWILGFGTGSDGVAALAVVRVEGGRTVALRVALDDGCHVHGDPLFPGLDEVTWEPDEQ